MADYMGVNGIAKLVNGVPGAKTVVKLRNLGGKKLAVDISIYLYKWWSIGKKYKIFTSTGVNMNHIQGLFYMTLALLADRINPIFVFDGKPPAEKTATLMQRAKTKTKTLSDGTVHRESPLRDTVESAKKLLDLMGVMWIDAPGEAEAQCAAMNAAGTVDGVLTEDTDVYPFGAKTVYSGIDISKGVVNVVNVSVATAGMGVNQPEFIYLCALLGNDYNARVGSAKTAIHRAKNMASGAEPVPTEIVATFNAYNSPVVDDSVHIRDYETVRKMFSDSSASLYEWIRTNYEMPAKKLKTGMARLGVTVDE